MERLLKIKGAVFFPGTPFLLNNCSFVINFWSKSGPRNYKKGIQKLGKIAPAKAIDYFEFSIPEIVYRLKYQGPYFFLFLWMLLEGQEIVHMIKTK